MEKYKINFINQTITVTAEFDKKMQDIESAEYALIQKVKADFPQMQVVRKTHRTPKYYVNKSGEVTKRNQFRKLTYEHMEQFMNGLPGKEKYLKEYQYLREHASKPQRSQYTLVRKWFTAQFPLFRNNPLFYLNNSPELIPAKEIENAVPEEENEVA